MKKRESILVNVFFILFSLVFIVPFLLVISISISNEQMILNNGYKLIPQMIDFTAYKYVFANPGQIIDSYGTTIFISIAGTVANVLVMSLMAYPLSRETFAYKKFLTFFIFVTMVFNGGLIPTYIWVSQYLHLSNTVWVYILPSLATGFHIIIFRTFFQGLPPSLMESAKIDGCSEIGIFFRIVLPLSKPVFATIALLVLLTKWNDWYTTLIYIRDKQLYTLQFLLQRILREAEFVKSMAADMPTGIDVTALSNTPTETIRFAMCVIAAGPMLVVFPFFQKYFAKGLTVGAVKG